MIPALLGDAGRPRLRPYQVDDLQRIEAAFAAGCNSPLYTAPTGSGKGVVIAEHARRAAQAGERVWLLAHRDEIVRQLSAGLTAFGVRHGFVAAGYDDHPARSVQVASVMTLARRLDRLRHRPDRLIIDEGHHAVAATWGNIISALPNVRILGCTATPRRLDGRPLDDVFDELIVGPSIASLIDQGHLAPASVFVPARAPDVSSVAVRAGDYAANQLATVMSHGVIINGAVDEWERLCSGVPTIAFAVNIAHSQLVAKAFRRRGWRAEHVDRDTPREQRRDLIDALGNGGIDVLSNCGLISEGLDLPGVIAAILLRPTKSLALYLQMVGRALRPAPGKDRAFVLDHAGLVFKHGLPTARRRWSLHGRHIEATLALRHCRHCGAVNPADAEFCEECGAVLREPQQQPRVLIEAAAVPLAEAIETPRTDVELATMGYRALLRWCANDHGRLRPDRLQRAARARGYKPQWATVKAGQHWQDAWAECLRWRTREATNG